MSEVVGPEVGFLSRSAGSEGKKEGRREGMGDPFVFAGRHDNSWVKVYLDINGALACTMYEKELLQRLGNLTDWFP